MMEPIAEVAATEEPDTAPKNIFASTFVAARYPGTHPTSSLARRTSRFAIPPLFIMLPPKEKNGRARREKESQPEKHLCAAVNAKIFPSIPLMIAVIMEAIPIPAEIGTPANSITKNEPNSINVA